MALPSVQSDPRALCLYINAQSPDGGLFAGDRHRLHPESRLPWRISPEPFWLNGEQHHLLQQLGPVLVRFYKAANLLYHQSAKGLQPAWVPAWVHRYLDLGKPERVVELGRMNRFRSHLPLILRPDLLLTAEGFRLTELDSVPGGMGFNALLARLYTELGYQVIGGPEGLVEGFYTALRATLQQERPVVALVVSDESNDYRAEMEWLAAQLQAKDCPVYCLHPKDLRFDDEGLLVETRGERVRVDAVYRFFELFDLPNIPKAEPILYFAKKNALRLTPPPKAYLEEKMGLAFIHHPLLQTFWEKELGEGDLALLQQLTPPTWIVDPTPAPPHTIIPGLQVEGRSFNDWKTLKHLTKKERELVLKPSGFSELAWGSHGVAIGHDLPEEEWATRLQEALDRFEQGPSILQKFNKASRLEARYYDFASDTVRPMHGRALVRPYYYLSGETPTLAGVQVILCPQDKKILHGMTEAIIAPAAEGGNPSLS
ncbi:MAG: hypothetical protein HYW07_23280 [Candidatus Latescibacteria bacterium]|nr:hypothetical protein [Candidatus Latescibacterota bacterium]